MIDNKYYLTEKMKRYINSTNDKYKVGGGILISIGQSLVLNQPEKAIQGLIQVITYARNLWKIQILKTWI